MNCKAEFQDCKVVGVVHEARPTKKKKGRKSERKKKKRKEAEGNNPRIYARLFDAGTIFKLSASAYDARVKSCGMDFRFSRGSRDERKDLLKYVANARRRRGP